MNKRSLTQSSISNCLDIFRKSNLIIYSKNNCIFCTKQKQLLLGLSPNFNSLFINNPKQIHPDVSSFPAFVYIDNNYLIIDHGYKDLDEIMTLVRKLNNS